MSKVAFIHDELAQVGNLDGLVNSETQNGPVGLVGGLEEGSVKHEMDSPTPLTRPSESYASQFEMSSSVFSFSSHSSAPSKGLFFSVIL